ncbi:MAG: glycosyltransferase family 39 protein [Proteobacteria bacterium]|nr:glycosyltransferase family 39 protein [Pseudomonadota bacterium]
MSAVNRAPWIWTGLWVTVMAVAVMTRPLLPVDETRYLSVAWEMWLSGDYLVPHLNGETYSHKPPLLFWLINLGWGVFGVNEWWPRLVAPGFGLASLFLTARLARELWPQSSEESDAEPIAAIAPLMLFGGLFWVFFTTLTMFDMMLAAFTLLGLIGTVRAWRHGGCGGLLLLGVGIGFGVLTKGPAILLHTLPVALAAPWWGPRVSGGLSKTWDGRKGLWLWYAGVFAAVIIGAGIGLAWAIPAGMAGGEAYRDAIFWGQSAGRIVSSFAHSRSWWWYGAVVPGMALPWLIWPPVLRVLWRALRGWRKQLESGEIRFCLAWFVPALVVFSVISGKQPHYLLPELPALALIAARLLTVGGNAVQIKSLDPFAPGLLAVILGALLVGLDQLSLPLPWLDLVAAGWGGVLIVAGLALMASGRLTLTGQISALAAGSAVMAVVGHLAMQPALRAVYDLKPLALKLAAWQRDGVPLANFSKYHGQYNFLGRLEKPIAQVGMYNPDTEKYIEAHPDAKIIAYPDNVPTKAAPVALYRFRSRFIAVWDAAVVARIPEITQR